MAVFSDQMKKTGLLSACLLFILSAYSQETSSTGPRSAALGNSSLTLKDPWCAVNNQAGLAFLRQMTAGVCYENRFLLKEFSTRSATLVLPFKTGTLGLSMVSFGYSVYHENKYNIAFGKAFSDKFSLGAAINYLHTHIADGTGISPVISGEMGMLVRLQKQLLLGIHLSDPVQIFYKKRKQEGLPVILKAGINYSFSSSVSLSLETAKELSRKALFKAGIEYRPYPSFFLRAGISNDPIRSAFGIGFFIQRFQMDLSASYHPLLGISSQIGLICFFGKNDRSVRDDQ